MHAVFSKLSLVLEHQLTWPISLLVCVTRKTAGFTEQYRTRYGTSTGNFEAMNIAVSFDCRYSSRIISTVIKSDAVLLSPGTCKLSTVRSTVPLARNRYS